MDAGFDGIIIVKSALHKIHMKYKLNLTDSVYCLIANYFENKNN